jgi:endonuclease/exonuclease/phosphatase family metal-dependent hydrolase
LKRFTKNILFQLNFLAACALLLSYAANHTTPAGIWPIAFFGLAYPYLLAINVFFIVFWTWRKKKIILVSIVVVLLGFSNVGRYIQIRNPKAIAQTDSSCLKVLSYNVRVFNAYHWNGKDIGRDSIISYVNSEEADIVCFQEFVTLNNVYKESETYTKQLFKENPFNHIRYTISTNSNTRKFGVATFSKHPIVRKGKIQFENSYNTCIYSDILFNNDTIRIYNVHLQSISLRKNYSVMDSLIFMNSKRLGEVREISSRLKHAFIQRARQVDAVSNHIEKSPYPVVVCGDFNDTPVSYSYHKILGDKKDSFREAGSGIGKTYRGNLPSYRIDYVFHSEDFKVVGYKTPKVKLSDHFPVVCTLRKTYKIN